MNVCEYVRDTRISLGLTQRELATLAGISSVDICKLEKSNYGTSPKVLKKISPFINTPYGELLKMCNSVKTSDCFIGYDNSEINPIALSEKLYKSDSKLASMLNNMSIEEIRKISPIIKVLIENSDLTPEKINALCTLFS